MHLPVETVKGKFTAGAAAAYGCYSWLMARWMPRSSNLRFFTLNQKGLKNWGLLPPLMAGAAAYGSLDASGDG